MTMQKIQKSVAAAAVIAAVSMNTEGVQASCCWCRDDAPTVTEDVSALTAKQTVKETLAQEHAKDEETIAAQQKVIEQAQATIAAQQEEIQAETAIAHEAEEHAAAAERAAAVEHAEKEQLQKENEQLESENGIAALSEGVQDVVADIEEKAELAENTQEKADALPEEFKEELVETAAQEAQDEAAVEAAETPEEKSKSERALAATRAKFADLVSFCDRNTVQTRAFLRRNQKKVLAGTTATGVVVAGFVLAQQGHMCAFGETATAAATKFVTETTPQLFSEYISTPSSHVAADLATGVQNRVLEPVATSMAGLSAATYAAAQANLAHCKCDAKPKLVVANEHRMDDAGGAMQVVKGFHPDAVPRNDDGFWDAVHVMSGRRTDGTCTTKSMLEEAVIREEHCDWFPNSRDNLNNFAESASAKYQYVADGAAQAKAVAGAKIEKVTAGAKEGAAALQEAAAAKFNASKANIATYENGTWTYLPETAAQFADLTAGAAQEAAALKTAAVAKVDEASVKLAEATTAAKTALCNTPVVGEKLCAEAVTKNDNSTAN